MKPYQIAVLLVCLIFGFFFFMWYMDEGYFLYIPTKHSRAMPPPTTPWLMLLLLLAACASWIHSPKASAGVFSTSAVYLLLCGIFSKPAWDWSPGWGHIGLTILLGILSTYMWMNEELCCDRS